MLSVYPCFYPERCPTANAAQYARHVGKKTPCLAENAERQMNRHAGGKTLRIQIFITFFFERKDSVKPHGGCSKKLIQAASARERRQGTDK